MAAVFAVVAVPAQAVGGRPEPVANVEATPGDSPGELVVTWDAHPDGHKDHRVAFKPVDGKFQPEGDTEWNAFPLDNTVTLTGLVPGAEYRVLVRARFADGTISKWARPVSGLAAEEAPPEPAAPDKTTIADDGIAEPVGETDDALRTHQPDHATVLDFTADGSVAGTLTSTAKEAHYTFTLTSDAAVDIYAINQTHTSAELTLYVGTDEDLIVEHGDGSISYCAGCPPGSYDDTIPRTELEPGTYGIKLAQATSLNNTYQLEWQVQPIGEPTDNDNNGGPWTAGLLVVEQGPITSLTLNQTGGREDVDWVKLFYLAHLFAEPVVTATYDPVIKFTVTSDAGAWLLVWGKNGRGIAYGPGCAATAGPDNYLPCPFRPDRGPTEAYAFVRASKLANGAFVEVRSTNAAKRTGDQNMPYTIEAELCDHCRHRP